MTEIGEHRLRGRHKGNNSHLFAHSICVVLATNSLKELYKSGKGTNMGKISVLNTIAGWLRVR